MPLEVPAPTPTTDTFLPIRIVYRKSDDFRFFSHLALQQYFEQIFHRSGLRFRTSSGFHPRIKLVMLPPLPVPAQGLAEVIEVAVAADVPQPQVWQRLLAAAQELPLLSLHYLEGRRPLMRDIAAMHYTYAGPLPNHWETLASSLVPASVHQDPAGHLHIDITWDGTAPQRFAAFYRQMDPPRQHLRHLVRTGVTWLP